MDYSQALKDAENALRDFIDFVMTREYGSSWYAHAGLSHDRISACEVRQNVERSKSGTVVVDERLTYYMNFEDLKTIVDRNWDGEFRKAFGNKRRFDAYWDILADYRNPDAHRRELLPHQKALVEGLSGEVRTMITRYRSQLDELAGFFPRFESVRDNLGNIWVAGNCSKVIDANMVLRPGDVLELCATASDPFDCDLEYAFNLEYGVPHNWSTESSRTIKVADENIGMNVYMVAHLRSIRAYHASHWSDDEVSFRYQVLPRE